METRRLQVLASTMAGKTVEFSMHSDDSLLYLRHQVSRSLGVSTWQLRLLLDGEILDKRGRLEDMVPTEAHELEVLTVTVPLPSEVASRSASLWSLLRHRITRDVLCRSPAMKPAAKERILLGEVDFFYNGDNLLEMAARSLPRSEAKDLGCLLLDGGADVNGQSLDGFTPLQTACCRGLVGLSELLLQRGANRFRASPTGEDALDCALGFLAACDRFGSQEREEDVDLAKLCCRLRNSRIERARSSGELQTALAKARLCLSRVATQLALLGGKFVKLSQEEVFEKSGLNKASVQSFGEHLWAGWPGAFLTFDTWISRVPDIQESFAHARSRVLSYRLSQNKQTIWTGCGSNRRDPYWLWGDYGYYYYDEWGWVEGLERGDCGLSIGEYYQKKTQNRKRDTAKANTRSCRRVAFEPSRRYDSHSARLARRMPRRDVQMARRKERLRGGRRNLSKFQLVRDQIWQ
ncbi:Ankrd53 [Symbiodinium sp. CCMP2592]|nr:Ankrd53 [Symbiodinium sp. CCMP2592]